MRSIVSGSTTISNDILSSPTGSDVVRSRVLDSPTTTPATPRKNLFIVGDNDLLSSTTASPISRRSVLFSANRGSRLEVTQEGDVVDEDEEEGNKEGRSKEVGSSLRSKDLEEWFPESSDSRGRGTDVWFAIGQRQFGSGSQALNIGSSQERLEGSRRQVIVPITIDSDDNHINNSVTNNNSRTSPLSPSRFVELRSPSHSHVKSFKIDGAGFVIPRAKFGRFGNERGNHVRRDGIGRKLILSNSSPVTPASMVLGKDIIDSKVAGQSRTTFDVTWRKGAELMEVRNSPTGDKFLLPTARLMKEWSLLGKYLPSPSSYKVSSLQKLASLLLFVFQMALLSLFSSQSRQQKSNRGGGIGKSYKTYSYETPKHFSFYNLYYN